MQLTNNINGANKQNKFSKNYFRKKTSMTSNGNNKQKIICSSKNKMEQLNRFYTSTIKISDAVT